MSQPVTSSGRRETIAQELRDTFGQMLGVDAASVSFDANFIELGADSLFLLRFNRYIKKNFGVKFPFRRLMEDVSSLGALADFLEAEIPPEVQIGNEEESQPSSQEAPVTGPPSREASPASPKAAAPVSPAGASPDTASVPTQVPGDTLASAATTTPLAGSALEQILEQQLQLMTAQLDLLRRGRSSASRTAAESAQPVSVDSSAPPPSSPASAEPESQPKPASQATARREEGEVYVPYRPVEKGSSDGLTTRQREHIADLVARVNALTPGSKEVASKYRRVLADSRTLAGFRMLWKELKYPLVAQRGEGSRLWDVDGNEYVDFTMGFGALLFGHNPPFLQDTLREQLELGLQLGAESEYAGRAAEVIKELTGCERVAFTNSGTEAVMSALRLARMATGRHKIALFEESYHGTFDGIMVRGEYGDDGRLQAVPMAPGIPKYMADEILILRFNDPESLSILEEHAGELAAILVEPPQSRRPDLQPQDFLRSLRRIADQGRALLIFDEVVTGFRFHPGGAQKRFGIQADLVTYGKAMSGGLPAAALAGKARYMEGIDGGAWGYGDDSAPDGEITFFAGTYFRHPLLMRSVHAGLSYVRDQGTDLQDRLDRLTARLADAINPFLETADIPVRVARLGSLFRFQTLTQLPYMDLFYYELLSRGIFICETRSCFVSTAHTEADVDRLVECVKESMVALCRAGLMPGDPSDDGNSSSGSGGKKATHGVLAVAGAEETIVAGAAEPMTEAQRDLWLLCQLGEDASRAYNESVILDLRGELDLEALRRSLQIVVDRHEALRTTFDEAGENQWIHPRGEVEIPLIDVSGGDQASPLDRAEAWIEESVKEPFDLGKRPLLRAAVVRLEPGHHRLVLTVHHLVADGWSFGILLAELAALYSAQRREEITSLPEPMPFREYARQQRQSQQEERTADEAYWLERFSDRVPVVDLPTDQRRPTIQSYRGDRFHRSLDPRVVQKLRTFARQRGSTLFNCALAIFQTLLHRLTGQSDVVVGIPAAGQASMDNPHLIGHCVNLLPLRSRITPEMDFERMVRQTKVTVYEAYEHQNYPFRSLVSQLDLDRDPSRLPLVNIVFNLDQGGAPEFAGLRVEGLPTPSSRVQWDLSWNLREEGENVLIECTYNADLFEHETVMSWAELFETLTEGAVTEPERLLFHLPLMRQEARACLLPPWKEGPAKPEACLHELFTRQVRRSEGKLAVVCGDRRLTYRQLERRSNRLAHVLRRRGVILGDVVGLCFEPSLDMVVAIVATLKAGAAYLPLDPVHPADRLSFMVTDASVSMVLCRGGLPFELPRGAQQAVDLETIQDELDKESSQPVQPDEGSSVEQSAYVIYTSGSTGEPKGVVVNHGNVVRLFTRSEELFGFSRDDIWTLFHSYAFDFSVWELWGALLYGGRLVVVPTEVTRSPDRFLQLLAGERVTMLSQTPSAFQQLDRYEESLGDEAPKLALRKVVFGGEALIPSSLAGWLRRHGDSEPRLINMYGITETTVHVSYRPLTAADTECSKSPIGGALPDLRMYLLDEYMEPVPVRVRGEIFVGGAGVSTGYLGRPRLTAERFVPDPFTGVSGARLYRSGDLARHTPDGDIEYFGRSDLQVKVRGFRIEVGEIEAALVAHPGVRQAVVIVRGERAHDRRLVAYLVLRKAGAVTQSGLRRFLQERLPDYMVPAIFVELPELPLNTNGKVDRDSLPTPDDGRLETSAEHVAPRDETEDILCRIWEQVLREESVGVEDNFFELGGDSILAMQIVTQAKNAGLRLTVRDIFQAQTVAALARTVGSTGPAEERGAGKRSKARAEETAPLTPIQHWFFEQNLADPHHWNMSIALEAREWVDPDRLRAALDLLARRHPALRLRFDSAKNRQLLGPVGEAIPLDHRRIVARSGETEKEAVQRAEDEWQRSLDLETGPVARMGLLDFGRGRPGRLIFVLHHLVVDILSRRILFGDLITAYEGLAEETSVELAPPTTPYTEWAHRLEQYAESTEIEDEIDFWRSRSHRRTPSLPVDETRGENTESSAQVVTVTLPEEETEVLLRQIPATHRTQILDALLAALVQAIAPWSGESVLRVDLEGHGREEIFDDVDVTQTVGWFTAIYPVVLDLTSSEHPGQAVEAVRDERRRIVDGGLGYGVLRYLRRDEIAKELAGAPAAEVSFNYLGRAGVGASTHQAIFNLAPGGGEGRSQQAKRRYLLEINGGMVDGQLQMMWRYSENRHQRQTIQAVADRFIARLRDLSRHLDAGDSPTGLLPTTMDRAAAERLVSQASFEE